MSRLLERYQAGLVDGSIARDPAQAEVIASLGALQRDIESHLNRPWYRTMLWQNPAAPKGRYLWGGVGRGKTWMMDLFYETLAVRRKQRVHFHRFMARVHHALKQAGSGSDPLADIALDWARRNRVLCFDEFYVSDIADAMLLSGLLQGLFEQGVILVTTSNSHPDRLYHGGLQRARFLPAIELLKQHTEVIHVGGDTDYRLRFLSRSQTYYHPLDSQARQGLEQAFKRMAAGCDLPQELVVNQRPYLSVQRAVGLIWFTFEELCVKPRGTADYIELAKSFNTVLISELPQLDDETADATRRFINLIDEFYDHNVKVLISAAQPIHQLYCGKRLSFEFERTRSRLTEMQSDRYLAQPHLP